MSIKADRFLPFFGFDPVISLQEERREKKSTEITDTVKKEELQESLSEVSACLSVSREYSNQWD